MARISKKRCWEILEDNLVSISESRIKEHCGEAKLAVAVLISAGIDNDIKFIESDRFKGFCALARLNSVYTRQLIEKTIEYTTNGGTAHFGVNEIC